MEGEQSKWVSESVGVCSTEGPAGKSLYSEDLK